MAGARFPLSAAIDAHYAALEQERVIAEARRRLRIPIRAALARGRRALEKLAEEAARVPAAEADRRVADSLNKTCTRFRVAPERRRSPSGPSRGRAR